MQARYSNPHPGRQGAAIRFPSPALAVARQLDGTECDLNEAVRRLQAALPDAEVEPVTDDKPYWIAVTVERGGETHLFKAIEFEPLEA